MGVPAFFRWLSVKYPSIVINCVETKGKALDDDGKKHLPVDTSEPNQNNIEFDNLYLDMNGIIHPCTHPENKPAPKNEAEMFVDIFEYIDRIFAIVRPRRLLYMAIDGVAPRAKMNQQRSRRFRAGKENREKIITLKRLREELLTKGAHLPPAKAASEHFDSNCITPGTPFMARLATALHYYIYDRLNSDPGWRNIQVILSDANVPGEGEHKIMDYIRRQRASPDHDPNTRHCLCGADADLIMLGLATHEPHFYIIREEFKPNQPRPCELCGQMGHPMEDCVGAPREDEEPADGAGVVTGADVEFIFIALPILREYLQRELHMSNLPFEYSFERAVDDWVFMCFFVGNDFLPHLPSLEIREKAIDRLVKLYKNAVYRTGGWLTDSGDVNLPRVQLILQELGQVEDEIFKSRRRGELNFRRRQKDRMRREGGGGRGGGQDYGKRQRLGDGPAWIPSGVLAPHALGMGRGSGPPPVRGVDQVERNLSNLDAAVSLKSMLRQASAPPPGHEAAADSNPRKRKAEEKDPEKQGEEEDANDEVKLWEDGWRQRYYESKFGVDPADAPEFCVLVGQEYVRGLCWVLKYYYQGCASWKWYFPYHYAPFASDFQGVAQMEVHFEKNTTPFNPLEQLMGVFPADSKTHVPPVWQDLMYNPDSPIIDFYPTDFKIDLNGKKYLWQGVALLPFVDEARLLKAVSTRYDRLTNDERARNVRGPDRIFCHAEHPMGKLLLALYEDTDQSVDTRSGETAIDPALTHGISGKVWSDIGVAHLPGETIPSPVPLCENIPKCWAISSCFRDPQFPPDYVFPAVLLKGINHPPVTLKPERMGQNESWRPVVGFGADGGHRPRNTYDSRPMQRMVGQSMGRGGAAVAPPSNLREPDRGSRRDDRGYGSYQQQSYRSGSYQPQMHQQSYGGGGGRGGGGQHYGQFQGGFVSHQGSHQGWQQGGYSSSNRGGGGYHDQRRGGSQDRRGTYPPGNSYNRRQY